MSIYTQTLCLTVPIALREIAKQLSRSIDEDVGGADAFSRFLDADSLPCEELDAVWTTYTSPCVEGFPEQAQYLVANPEALHATVAADYATRWAEFTPPTLEEVQSFCAQVVVA